MYSSLSESVVVELPSKEPKKRERELMILVIVIRVYGSRTINVRSVYLSCTTLHNFDG